ncbi:2-succinyl-5-enolpyruvyl-6-hydroxy-3-cyclohexene-1-carboxylic-acid synthase [Sulfobacillus sp. hq2]|nr:2-succinyl-5-enolpyruvyl-6-hydroxy-3-cyclohexene-1-carboxylic-acid synthase [Sulfobacillus sp. hq2]
MRHYARFGSSQRTRGIRMETTSHVKRVRSEVVMSTQSSEVGRYLAQFVISLEHSGVTHAVICPGSRSTPLSLALYASHLKTYVLMDERSAAFFALGIAKNLRRPTLLVSTSGTAAANFMPAVVEAFWSHVPLIVLTADRPPELRDSGAAQTIDQIRLYGSHVKWFQDMPLADGTEILDRFANITAQRAAITAQQNPAGPVHLNFPFREPLLTVFPDPSTLLDPGPARIIPAQEQPNPQGILLVAQWLRHISQGFIVAGPGHMAQALPAMLRLSRQLGWPIWADPLSNLRGLDPAILGTHDAILRAHAASLPTPQAVIRIGAPPTSKALNQFIAQSRLVVIDAENSYREPMLQEAQILQGSADQVLDELATALSNQTVDPAWHHLWQEQDRGMRAQLAQRLASVNTPNEPSLYYHLVNWLAPLEPVDVFVSNSMPIRDVDAFTLNPGRQLRFWANRGANGIDGVTSTALGMSAVQGQVVLITGDLAFYHDMNGLLAAKKYGLNALIIVVNNDGGGIFSFLPQSQLAEPTFEALFGTPHGLTFEHAAALYHAAYRHTQTVEELKAAIQDLAPLPGLRIIEWHTASRQDNVSWHAFLWGDPV